MKINIEVHGKGHGGLVVSTLDSGSRGPGSSPCRVIVLCSWARHFTLTVPLSTQGNLTKCWGVTCDGLASHPGGVAIFLVASCYRNWDKLRQSWATRIIRLNLPTPPPPPTWKGHLLKSLVKLPITEKEKHENTVKNNSTCTCTTVLHSVLTLAETSCTSF